MDVPGLVDKVDSSEAGRKAVLQEGRRGGRLGDAARESGGPWDGSQRRTSAPSHLQTSTSLAGRGQEGDGEGKAPGDRCIGFPR